MYPNLGFHLTVTAAGHKTHTPRAHTHSGIKAGPSTLPVSLPRRRRDTLCYYSTRRCQTCRELLNRTGALKWTQFYRLIIYSNGVSAHTRSAMIQHCIREKKKKSKDPDTKDKMLNNKKCNRWEDKLKSVPHNKMNKYCKKKKGQWPEMGEENNLHLLPKWFDCDRPRQPRVITCWQSQRTGSLHW